MRIQIQLRIVADDNSVISEGEILHFDKGDEQSVQLPGSSALLILLANHFSRIVEEQPGNGCSSKVY